MKFRIWDNDNDVMEFISMNSLEKTIFTLDSYLDYFGSDYLKEVPPMLSLNIKDKDGVEVYESDLRMYKGKMYQVVNNGWRFTLERNMYHFGENETVVIDEDVVYLSSYVGNIHQNSNLLLNEK